MLGKRFLLCVVLIAIMLFVCVICVESEENLSTLKINHMVDDYSNISQIIWGWNMSLLVYKTSKMDYCLPTRKELSLEELETIEKRMHENLQDEQDNTK